MEYKAMKKNSLSSLKACLLVSCCLLAGFPVQAQEAPALPDLEAVLPPRQDDGEANGLTLLPEGDAASGAEPAVVPTPIPEAGRETAISANPEEPAMQPVEAQAVDGGGWTGSLMFDDEKVKNLLAIYRAYLLSKQQEGPKGADGQTAASQVNVGDIIGKLTGDEKPKEIVEEVLKISLNSIVFDSATQWSMWVNGQRFSRKVAEEGFTLDNSQLRVLQANNREVTYLWVPMTDSYNLVRQRWEDKKNRGNIFTNTQAAQNERVEFNEEARTVSFTLRPNQTFVSQFMSVMEGADKIRSTQAAAEESVMGSAEHAAEDIEGHRHPEEDGERSAYESAEGAETVPASPSTDHKASPEVTKAPARNFKNAPPSGTTEWKDESAPPPQPVDPNAGIKEEEGGETSAPFSKGQTPGKTEVPGKKVLSGSNQ